MSTELSLNERNLAYSRLPIWSSASCDLLLIFAGVLALFHRPDSVVAFGITGILAAIWVTMLGGGAALSLVGVLIRKTSLEVFGSSAVGGGFILWGITLLSQDTAGTVSVSLALVFFSSAAIQFYRITTLPVVSRNVTR